MDVVFESSITMRNIILLLVVLGEVLELASYLLDKLFPIEISSTNKQQRVDKWVQSTETDSKMSPTIY